MFKSLLGALYLACSASATFILLPLYIDPGTPTNAWAPVFSAIAQYPSVQWQIIVNPNSGPGGAPNSYPPTYYANAIAQLNSYSNVMTLGYVSTNYTNRAYSLVQQDIATYANWANYTPMNISMAGIFFDEATSSTTTAALRYMRNAANYAYAQVPSDITPVVFNPGQVSPTQYFQMADTLVEFEGYYSAYNNQTTINTFPSGYKPQSAIIVHSSTATTAQLSSLVHNIIVNQIGGVYFTTDCCYNSLSSLAAFAAAVAAG